MPIPRIAIASPNLNIWSETFIAAHLQLIPGQVMVLSEGKPPRHCDGQSILLPTTFAQSLRSQWEVRVQHLAPEVRTHRNTIRLLRERKVQVLLAEYGPTGASLVRACKEAGVPMVVHFHGYDAHVTKVAEEWGHYDELFEYASAVIAVSRSMEKRLMELGAPRDKVHYVPYGVDVSRFAQGAPSKAPAHFVGIGRFVDKKAPHLTLLAFHKVFLEHPEARLTLVGDGPLREACLQIVRSLGLENQVSLPGIATPEQVSELLRTARAFVQHSIVTSNGDSEGTPLAVLEAMACGLPVVATKHAGIGDVVTHGITGLLCEELDIDGMATHMMQLAEDPALAGSLGQAARAYVEMNHRVEKRVAELHSILQQVALP